MIHRLAALVVLIALALAGVFACSAPDCAAIARSASGAAFIHGARSLIGNIIPTSIADALCGENTPGGSNVAPNPFSDDAEGHALVCFKGSPCAAVRVCLPDSPCTTINACSAASDDTACNTCVKTSCCAQTSACLTDPGSCLCLVGGATAAQCGAEPDTAYDDLGTCLADHCAAACKSLGQP